MAETNTNTNTEKNTEANNEGGMNVSTSIPKSIVMSSSASYEKSMLIDIFDIGYTQSNLMAIYTTLSDTVSKAYDALTADDLKSKIEAAVKPFAEDPWGVADKLVQNIKEKVNEVSKIEVNATYLLEQLNKQIDEDISSGSSLFATKTNIINYVGRHDDYIREVGAITGFDLKGHYNDGINTKNILLDNINQTTLISASILEIRSFSIKIWCAFN